MPTAKKKKKITGRPFTSGDIMVRCNINLDNFHYNYRIATVSHFTYDISLPDVKSLNQMYIL